MSTLATTAALLLCYFAVIATAEDENTVNPFKKRCNEGKMCGFHLQFGRCTYELIQLQCPCTCASYNDESGDDDGNSNETEEDENTGGLAWDEWTMLREHNVRRRHHGLPNYTWDPELAATAQDYCSTLARNNNFKHGKYAQLYGENLFWSSGRATEVVPGKAVKDWYDEIELYDYNNPGFSGATGHFTQMIWSDNTELGCASTDPRENIDEKVYVCCHYTPGGNWRGEYGAKVPRPTNGQAYSE